MLTPRKAESHRFYGVQGTLDLGFHYRQYEQIMPAKHIEDLVDQCDCKPRYTVYDQNHSTDFNE